MIIGNHVWIGMDANVLECSIGDNSIVGTASVVKGTYPTNCVIAGSIAKVVRKNVNWDGNNGISYERYLSSMLSKPCYATLGYGEQLKEVDFELQSAGFTNLTNSTSLEYRTDYTSVLLKTSGIGSYVLYTNGLNKHCYLIGFSENPIQNDAPAVNSSVTIPICCLIPDSYLGYPNNYWISFQSTETTQYIILYLDDAGKPLQDFDFKLFQVEF